MMRLWHFSEYFLSRNKTVFNYHEGLKKPSTGRYHFSYNKCNNDTPFNEIQPVKLYFVKQKLIYKVKKNLRKFKNIIFWLLYLWNYWLYC